MAQNRRLETDQEFQEVLESQAQIRVFKDDQIIDSGVVVTRYNEETIVVNSGISGLNYHKRKLCEFFETRKR
jgi:hypothetical protein